jgi:hypothetical protein
MFSVAYVILPFADTPPADAITASLTRFQRGRRGDLPDDWLAFHDETEDLRSAHETQFRFTDHGKNGLGIEGGSEAFWYISGDSVQSEMRRRDLQIWDVRFADTMDLDTFNSLFGKRLERHPLTGDYGRWLNPLGRWDWWDLGGRFDGYIMGEPDRSKGRKFGQVSSGQNSGRVILSNIEDQLRTALGREPVDSVEVGSDRNIELAATLLQDIKADRENACPGSLVLPPGSVKEHLRWLDTWPKLGPVEAFAWLDLRPDACWQEVVKACYSRFQDHWVAGIAYHH